MNFGNIGRVPGLLGGMPAGSRGQEGTSPWGNGLPQVGGQPGLQDPGYGLQPGQMPHGMPGAMLPGNPGASGQMANLPDVGGGLPPYMPSQMATAGAQWGNGLPQVGGGQPGQQGLQDPGYGLQPGQMPGGMQRPRLPGIPGVGGYNTNPNYLVQVTGAMGRQFSNPPQFGGGPIRGR